MTSVYIIYKCFEDWIEPIPSAAYSTVTRAHQEVDRLNNDRTNEELKSGMFYYVKDAGVLVYE